MGAGHLKIGDQIKQADGTLGVIANVVTVQQTQEMFNLTVSEAHTYYVGQDGWLVHNQRAIDCPIYSVGFEAKLLPGQYPGVSSPRHFQEANRQLFETFNANPTYAARMEAEFPGIAAHVQPGARGAFSRESPPFTSWHHEPNRPGVLQLVPREQHNAPGPIQQTLHPNGRGGMENWGGGRK